jgi:hypothetical protein
MSVHRKFAVSGLATCMGKTQKVKCFRLSLAPALAVLSGKSAKFDQPCFALMQLQIELSKTLSERLHEPFSVLSMLKPHNEVVGKANNDDITPSLPTPPLFDPEVEHIMQIDVGEQWADAPTLRNPFLAVGYTAVFQHPGIQPLFDVP